MANQIKYQVGFDVQKQGLNDLKSSLQQLQKMKLSDIMNINNTDINKAREIFKQISGQARKVEQALTEAFNPKLGTINIQTFKNAIGNVDGGLVKLHSTFAQAGAKGEAAFRNLTVKALGMNTQIKESHALLDKMATTLGNTVKWHAASAAINGMSRSVQQAWGFVKHLDGSLNDIRIVTGKSSDQMARFAEQASNAAKSLGRTTTDYTDAALIFAQQGLSDQEIAKRSEITLKAANVTGQSTEDVSEQLTAVWNGYKVNAEEAELYVDRLAAVAATTASDLEELSKGMGKVAAAANEMGVGEDQLAAQLSTIISVTRQAPESVGTALRTVYARISDIKAGIDEDGVTLGKYSGDMAELGFNVLDASGHLRDMGQVMEQIGGRWGDLTREQQVNLAQTMAGQRQYSNLMALFENFDKYNDALATAQGAVGTLEQQQNTYMESTAAHLNQLKTATQDIYRSFVDTNSVNTLVDSFTKIAEVVSNFVESIGGGEDLLKSLGAIATTVFSQQISQGLLTTINNLKGAREQAQLFKSQILEIQNLQKSKVGGEDTQYIANQLKDFQTMRGSMSDTQVNEVQKSLQSFAQTSGKLEEAKEEIQNFERVLNQAGITSQEMMEKYGSLNDMLSSSGGFQRATESLQRLRQAYKPIEEEQEKLTQIFEKMRNNPILQNREDMTSGIQGMLSKIGTQSGQGIFDSLSESAKTSISQIQQSINSLDFFQLSPKEQFNVIQESYFNLKSTIQKQINSIENTLTKAKNGQIQLSQEKISQLEKQKDAWKNYVAEQKKAVQEGAQVKQFVDIAGGISQMAMAMQQLKNIGSIFSNDDLTAGQKMLQLITNLSFSLPMLINGYSKLNEIYQIKRKLQEKDIVTTVTETTVKEGEAAVAQLDAEAQSWLAIAEEDAGVAAGGAATGHTANAVAQQAEAAAAGKAAGATGILNKTLLTNPIFLVVAAFAALVAVLSQVKKGMQQANKEAIENAKTNIDEQNKIQQEINSRKQLYNSLDELNEKYKNHQITRTQLKQQTAQLVSQYDLEKSAVQELTSNYDKLGEAIAKQRLEDAKAASKSAQEEKRNAITQVQETGNGIGNKTTIGISSATQSDKKILDLVSGLKEVNITAQQGAQAIGTTTYRMLELGDSAQEIVASYDAVSAAIEQTGMTQQQLDKSPVYKSICDWLKKMKDSVEAYKQAIEQASDSEISEKGFQAIADNKVDFDNINSLSEYKQQRQALIKQLGSGENADTFLKNQFAAIYNQYSEASTLIDNLRQHLGSTNQEVEDLIGTLDEGHFAALIEQIGLDGEIITNWQLLRDVIQGISDIDLSNINTEQGQINLENLKQSAADQYNKYQSVEDQVKDGKTVSKTQYKDLEPEIQQFFSMMANGSYKMTGDAKDFYETVNNLKLDGFHQSLSAIEDELDKVNRLQSLGLKGDDYQNNNKVAQGVHQKDDAGFDTGKIKLDEANTKLVENQIKYLKAVEDSSSAVYKLAENCESALKTGEIQIKQAEMLAQEYEKAGDQTKDLVEKENALTQAARELAHQTYEAMYPLDQDIDTKQLQDMTEVIQDMADESEELADILAQDSEAAEDIAASILRFDDAIQDVTKNYDDWMAALENGSLQDQAEVIDGLKDAYSDLLDLDGDSLSDAFLKNTDNLQKMKEAANGSTQAYDELLQRAGRDILTQVGLDTSKFDSDRDRVWADMEQLTGQKFPDIEVGANLNDQGFLQGLTDMVNAAGMTAAQATDYLASMGVDAQVIEDKTTTKDQTEIVGSDANVHSVPVKYKFDYMDGKTLKSYTGNTLVPQWQYVPKKQKAEGKKENSSFALKVTSAKKSSGGKFKFKQSKHGGGSAGGSGGSGGSGGGGGSGGSGGGKAKDTKLTSTSGSKINASIEKLDHVENMADPYYKVNNELEKMDRQLKDIVRDSDNAFGKTRIKLLNDQAKKIDEQITKLKQKQNIQKQQLKTQQTNLTSNYGATFDTEGNITNYKNLITAGENRINSAIDKYNKEQENWKKASDAHDANIKKQETLKKAYSRFQKLKKKGSKRTAAENTEFKNLKTQLKSLLHVSKAENIDATHYNKKMNQYIEQEKALKNTVDNQKNIMDQAKDAMNNQQDDVNQMIKDFDEYGDTRALGYEIEEDIKEKTQEAVQIRIDAFNAKIQMELDFGEAERDWIKFKRDTLEKDDIFKDNSFSKIIKDVKTDWDTLISYLQNKNGEQGSLIDSIMHLKELQKEIDTINSGGFGSIYGTNLNQAIEDYKDYFDDMKEQYADVQDLISNIQQSFLDTIDAIEDSFDEQINRYQDVTDLLEYDLDLLNLLYGEKNYSAMDSYYTQLTNNQLKELDLLRRQNEFWYKQWQDAAGKGQTELAKQFEKKYKETFSNLNSTLSESIQVLQDKYINSINQIFDNLDSHITQGQKTDYIELDWELKNKNTEGYLDTIEAAFAVNNLEDKFQDLLKNTKSIKNQQAIKKVMDQQLKNLKDKQKITEYDINRAEQLLQIEQARAALEDAQAAKTELRLKRDSQGNYSYEYTASMQATTEAEQKLLEAQNNLYKMDKQQYQNNLNDMLSIWKDFQSQYIDILNDTNLTEEEKRKRQQLLEKEYGEYINNLTAENFNIRNNLSESALASFAEIYNTSLKDLGKLSDDQKQNLMADLITGWDGGIQTMIDQVTGEGGFAELIKDSLGEIEEKTEKYQESLEDASIMAGKNLNDLKIGVDNVTSAYDGLIDSNINFVNEMEKQVDAIKSMVENLDLYKNALNDIFSDENGIESFQRYFQNQYTQAMEPKNVSNLDFSQIEEIYTNAFNNSTDNLSQIMKDTLDKMQLNQSEALDKVLSKYFPININPQSFASGGYTGSWNNSGKLALLHQKELVLNEIDTKNLLDTISILKTIDTSLNTNLINRVQDISNQLVKENSNSAVIEQQVHIEASFPNVNSKRQIEEAFNDLVNLAAQRAMRK